MLTTAQHQQQRRSTTMPIGDAHDDGEEFVRSSSLDDDDGAARHGITHHQHLKGKRTTERASPASTSSLTDQQQQQQSPTSYLPTHEELALLCLDHLRDVRRCMAMTSSSAGEAEEKENIRRGHQTAAAGTLGVKKDDEKKDDEDAAIASSNGTNKDEYDVSNLHSSLNPHYLTIAVWALQRAFVKPPLSVSNDPVTDHMIVAVDNSGKSSRVKPKKLPTLPEMEAEVLVATSSEDPVVNEFDNTHPSNGYRFYRNHGLGGGSASSGQQQEEVPWTLGELVSAGLSGLESKSRNAAEQELCQSTLFQQFVTAVAERGFFDDHHHSIVGTTTTTTTTRKADDPTTSSAAYQEKFQKVVAKFRSKLACRIDDPSQHAAFTGDWVALAAAEKYGHVHRQMLYPHRPLPPKDNEDEANADTNDSTKEESRFPASLKLSIESPAGVPPAAVPRAFFAGPSPRTPAMTPHHEPETPHHLRHHPSVDESQAEEKLAHTSGRTENPSSSKPVDNNLNDASLQAAAEALKNQGNVHMQQREFDKAADCYSKAIQLCPSGPHSHVYYSNRAAALVSVREFHLAIADSQRSLALKPDYGKAYARLGLAHFLLGQYELAVQAYKQSLRYEPDNRSSQNYLDKATRRLADQKREHQLATPTLPPAAAAISSQQSAMGTSSVGAKAPAGRMDPAGISNTSQSPPPPTTSTTRAPTPSHSEHHHRHEAARRTPTIASSPSGTPLTAQQQQAEKYKAKGNQFMVQREYSSAYDAYTRAIELSSDGPQSHVYYSNRAAALCYLERYRDAERDSLSSLKLVPGYGKAHARLGLSRFFVGDYEGAVSSYKLALEHDPDNAASKSYLLKAQAKLQQQQQQQHERGKE